METSVARCQMLLEPLRMTCQLHGVDVPEYQLIFRIINLTIRYAQKDDIPYYLLLLEDAFHYLEKYRFRSGMEKIIQELSVQIHKGSGTQKDQAILLDCKAQMTDDPQESLKLMKQALALLPDITEENALLVSNLNANIGGTYRMMGQYDLAKQHMETAMHILEQHHLTEYHDCYAQIINYAMLLGDMGEPEKGLIGLKKAEQLIQDVNPHSYDHGILLQAKGMLQLSAGDTDSALSNLRYSLHCFAKAFDGDEALLMDKRKEIEALLQMAGLPQDASQKFLNDQ